MPGAKSGAIGKDVLQVMQRAQAQPLRDGLRLKDTLFVSPIK